MKTTNKKEGVSKLMEIASNQGFEHYGSFAEEDSHHDILTCNKGKYDGEVIDIYSEWFTGEVIKVEYSCQWKSQTAKFNFSKYWDAQPVLAK